MNQSLRLLAMTAFLPLMFFLSGCATPPTPEVETHPEPETVRVNVVEEVSQPLELNDNVRESLEPRERFMLGIEVEQDLSYPNLRSRRIALVTDPTAIDQSGVHTIERMANSLLFTLAEVIVIEDGITTSTLAFDRAIEGLEDQSSPPRIHQLTREEWRLTSDHFRFIDTIVWDAALRGTRVNLDMAVLGSMMEHASIEGMDVLVCDRPMIFPRRSMEGLPSDPQEMGSRTAYFPLPVYPAMTAGELAVLFNEDYGLRADLTVRWMREWERSDKNEWLENERPGIATEAGLEQRRDVLRGPIFIPGVLELYAAHALAGDGNWMAKELQLYGEDGPQLIVAPRDMGAVTLMERLTAMEPMGVDFIPTVLVNDEGGEMGAVQIRPNGEGPVEFFQLAMSLHYCIAPNPRNHGPDNDLDVFQTDFIERGLSRGLTPDRLRRRWLTTPPFRDFQSTREGVLYY